MTEEEAKFFTACLIQGIEEIHAGGYVQRDIKPLNVLFNEKGYIIYTDFGLSVPYDMNAKDK